MHLLAVAVGQSHLAKRADQAWPLIGRVCLESLWHLWQRMHGQKLVIRVRTQPLEHGAELYGLLLLPLLEE
jgi:hypothetical protein